MFIENEEDPFADLEDHNEGTNLDEDPDAVELQYLMDQLQTEDPCSVEQFIQADTELPTCQDIFRDNWEDFLNQVAGSSSKTECLELVDSEEDEEEEEEEDNEIRQPKLKTFKEAIESIENVTAFLDFRGFTALASDASQLENTMVSLHFELSKARQST